MQDTKPHVLQVTLDKIPDELKLLHQWVEWRFDFNGRWTKPPYQPNGVKASTTDSRTWSTADNCYKHYTRRGFDGIGFVLTNDDPYVIIDLDHVRDPETGGLDPNIVGIMETFNSYTEVSPSGTGVHIVIKGVIPSVDGKRKGNFEIYQNKRYITFTGYTLMPYSIQTRQVELERFIEEYMPDTAPNTVSVDITPSVVHRVDNAILDTACRAKNGDKVKALFDGKWSDYPSQSEADMALATHLAFYTQDHNQLENLMRGSALNREKWNRDDYLKGTIERAISRIAEHYDPSRNEREPVGQLVDLDEMLSLFKTGRQISEMTPAEVDWIFKGYVACGAITEIDGAPKSAGKTTFTTHLVKAVTNGSQFLGEPTSQTPVVYLTEENMMTFNESIKRSGLVTDDLHVLSYSDSKSRDLDWSQSVELAYRKSVEVGARLLVVDTLPSWVRIRGDGENHSGQALEAMEPLLNVRAKGLAIVIIRHDRKGGGEIGESARGSNAFGGSIDIICQLRRGDGNTSPTVRVLTAIGRFNDIPSKTIIDYNALDGEYVSLGSETQVKHAQGREIILDVMPTNEADALTRKELFEASEVKSTTGNDIIKELQNEGIVSVTGTGKKGDAQRFWINSNGRDVSSDLINYSEDHINSNAI